MAASPLRVGFFSLARLSFDMDYAGRLFRESLAALGELDVELVHSPELLITEDDVERAAAEANRAGIDAAVIQYTTFSLGGLMPILAQRLTVPIILWAVPEPALDGVKLRSNSLCGVNMNAHTLYRMDRAYDYVFCTPAQLAEELGPRLSVLACRQRLQHARVGLVGYRVPGFYTSTCDELELRRVAGVAVHHVTLAEVFEQANSVSDADRREEAERIRSEAACVEITDDELDKAAALYLAHKRIADEYGLDGLAVKCWPEFPGSYGIAVCSTIGRLNDQGVPTSCEGDVLGCVTMLAERYLTGQVPFFADFVHIDESDNTGVAWHCGAGPVCLARRPEDVKLCKHSVVDGGGKKGVTSEFPIKAGGPVTMARIGTARQGLRLFAARGEAVETDAFLPGNPLRIRFDAPVRQIVDTILRRGFEHHFVVVHADVRDALRRLGEWFDIECVDVDA